MVTKNEFTKKCRDLPIDTLRRARGRRLTYRTHMRTRSWLALGAIAIWGMSVVAACKSATLGPQGGECALATDCQPGLVCIAKQDGTRTCESDLTSVTKAVPPGARDTGADGTANDGDTPDAPVVPPTDGATLPDTSPPPVDASPDTARPDASDGSVG